MSVDKAMWDLRESVEKAVKASGLYRMLGGNACEVGVTIRSGQIGDLPTMEVVATMMRVPPFPKAKVPGN